MQRFPRNAAPYRTGYFGSKDGLYVAYVERAGARPISALEDVLVGTEPSIKMAEATLRADFTVLVASR